VGACQGKLSALIVVERGGRPTLIHMAVPAPGDSVFRSELARVRIRMAGFAILRRSLELNLVRIGRHFVTLITCNRSMTSEQREFCFRMIEASDIHPGPGTMAGFATECDAIRSFLRHAVFEFAFMRIGVACGAGGVREMESQHLVGPAAKAGLVTLGARHRDVRTGQYEMGVLVLRDGEGGAMKVFYRVAIFAAILVGNCCELVVMRIFMAICARSELHFVNGFLAGWRVAFVTGDGGVLSLQRIMGRRMFLHAKLRWLPALDRVALRTLTLARSRLKLPFVRIGRVAGRALGKSQRLFEIAPCVTFRTANFQMHSQQRVFCF
jgi:hypothetical protein